MKCRYCQIELKDIPYRNCRYYAEQLEAKFLAQYEMNLFKYYETIPLKWRESDEWRTNPKNLKAGATNPPIEPIPKHYELKKYQKRH